MTLPRSRRALLLAGLFLLAALGTRFARLGERPLHHDESIHAHQSYTLWKGGEWRYDPAYHGPFLYYANALVYSLVGATDATARALPAVFGLILIGFAWPLSRWLGRGGAFAYALFVLISPTMTYFSRFIREDLYSAVFTLGTIIAFQRFLETDRARYLFLSAASFALAGVTKENAYMTGVLLVAYGLWKFAEAATADGRLAERAAQVARNVVAWVTPRLVPVVSAGVLFLLIWTVMYTAFGKHPEDWLAIPKAVKYWMGQHAIARIPGPWYYYFPMLAFYETAAVLAALCAFPKKAWRDDPFLRFVLLASGPLVLYAVAQATLSLPGRPMQWVTVIVFAAAAASLIGFKTRAIESPPFLRFAAFWAVGALGLYAWAREKVPWLTVHSLLPIVVLAGFGTARLWWERSRRGARMALAAIGMLLIVNTTGMLLACFRYGAHDKERDPKHAEMLAYVQTSRELVRELGMLDRIRPRVPGSEPIITVSGDAAWPLTWYLRDVTTRWVGERLQEASTPVVVADWEPDSGLEKQLAEGYTAKRVPIRSWWFPEMIREAGKPARPPSIGQLARWWLFHEVWSEIGSQDSTFFVRRDALTGEGPLAPSRIEVKHIGAADYPVAPATLDTDRTIGGPGAGDLQFAEPRGLAFDGRGNLYVADTKNHRVQVIEPRGGLLRSIGTKGNGDGQFNEPCGLAVDETGGLWVADTWNHRIVRFGPDGRFLGNVTDSDRGFFGPRGVAVGRDYVYVTDTGNKRIVRFDREGRKVGEWGQDGDAEGQFIEPVGIATDPSGRVYVADTGNHRIQVFDAEGKFQRAFPIFGWKDFYTEPYIAVGPGDALFVSDSWGGRAAHYGPDGQLVRSWRPPEPFKAATGIAVDPLGRIAVSDRGTSRIYFWTLSAVLVPEAAPP